MGGFRVRAVLVAVGSTGDMRVRDEREGMGLRRVLGGGVERSGDAFPCGVRPADEVARATAEVTHNHPEGIKGAEATAAAIFMARQGKSKEEIKEYIVKEFNYDLSRTLDDIRPGYHHVESCQETVPEAITAFLEGVDFEDVVRGAVSLSGDCDTLTCIAASIGEAFFGIPEELKKETLKRIDPEMREVYEDFTKAIQ